MPTGSLDGKGKALWEQVYNESKKNGDSQEVAARKAWAAVESAGWHKDDSGKWVKGKSVALAEFSLAIKKASIDPKTGERHWRADTSDIGVDSHGDSMSLELFADFIQRIESGERPPEEYCSEFWSGGEPYVSISHYPDLDGDAVPGISEKTYVDGSFLKAKGKIFNNPIGDAAWKAIKYDLSHRSEVTNPVRVSIAFLDYEHVHKSSGTVYTRTDESPVCLECLLAELKGQREPKIYRKGHLIHYAMTRVPVNKRTIFTTEAEMTTRVEDAESIIGKSLAEELEEKAQMVGKAELVIKSESEGDQAPASEPTDESLPTLAEVVRDVTELRSLVVDMHTMLKAMHEKPKEEDEKGKETMDEECAEGDEECMKGCKKTTKKSEVVEPEPVAEVEQVDMVQMLSEAFAGAMVPVTQKLDILIAASSPRTPPATVPQRRSITKADLPPVQKSDLGQPGAPMSIRDFARKSVGIE